MDDDEPDDDADAAADALRPQTLAYLDALAAGSFKRQEELDESVWRSLPFFAAAFALATTIVSRTAASAPSPTYGAYPIVANAALALALLSFGWALRWFYEVLRARLYDYPPGPAAVRDFADRMTAYYAQSAAGEDADAAVTDELRRMMIAAHVTATRTNFLLNEARFEARGQLILFLMVGFLMTLACEAIIYTHDLVGRIATREGSSDDRRILTVPAAGADARQARRAEGLHAGARREVPALERDPQAGAEALTGTARLRGSRPPAR